MQAISKKPILLVLGTAAAALIAVLFWGNFAQNQNVFVWTISLVGALLAVTVFMPVPWMVMMLFLYLGFEGFFKITLDYNPIVHVGADLYTGLIILRMLADQTEPETTKSKYPPFTKWIVAHLVWFAIAFLNPYQLSMYASLAGMKMYVTMVMLFFVGYKYTRSIKSVWMFIAPWIAVVVFQSIFSIYQATLGPASVVNLHEGYITPLLKFHGYAFRPFGFSAVAGGPAVFVFLTSPLIFLLILFHRRRSVQFFAVIVMTLAWLTLFLCQVRSAIIKAIIGTGIFVFFFLRHASSKTTHGKWMRFKMIAIPAVIALLLSFAFNWITGKNEDMVRAVDRSYSSFSMKVLTQSRRDIPERLLEMITLAPLGAGLSRTGAASGKFSDAISKSQFFNRGFFTDNFWLAVQVDLGLPGLVILNVIVFGVLILAFRSLKKFRDPRLQMTCAAILSCLCASVAGFYGAESILYNPEAAFFWFFAGVVLKLPQIDSETSA